MSVVFFGSSAHQETAAIIDSACDERMNECSDRVVIKRTSDAVVVVEKALSTNNVDMLVQ